MGEQTVEPGEVDERQREREERARERLQEKRERLDQRFDRFEERVIDRTRRPRPRGGSGLFAGALLTLLGVLLLLDNLGIVEFRDIWRYWPLIFIAMGVGRILSSRRPSGYIWGGLFILFGSLFLLRNLNLLGFHVDARLIAPLILIGIGLMMLVRTLERSRYKLDENCRNSLEGNTLSEWAVFTGTKRRVYSKNFEGGELFAMFGGIDIDMRDTAMTKPQVNIDVQAMFGGVELRVPESWAVEMRGLAVFGGYDDKTVPPRVEEGKTSPRLIITGHAIFGGVAVRN
ncbi:MAG: DUF5668 domain-containing protein [Bryobacteraceae bacterium]